MKKILILAACFVVLIACNGKKADEGSTAEKQNAETGSADNAMEKISRGKIVYETNCKLCHGEDGTLGASGAANLKTSTLKETDLITIVSYGKNAMMGYKDIISKEEVENVVAYIETLRK